MNSASGRSNQKCTAAAKRLHSVAHWSQWKEVLIESGEVMLFKNDIVWFGSVFILPQWLPDQTYPVWHPQCSGLQCEANKISSTVTRLFLLCFIPQDECPIVQGHLGSCGNWILMLAHENNNRVRYHTPVGLPASAPARVRVSNLKNPRVGYWLRKGLGRYSFLLCW